MGFKCGLVGLPNVGKSTIFNALTAQQVDASNYPFCTIEPNVGIVPLKDQRLDKIGEIIGSAKVIPTTLEFIDIAGLVEGASKGEGLGNQFLNHIQGVDAIVHVVRCFKDENVAHSSSEFDAVNDVAIVLTELIMKDLEIVERRISKLKQSIKSGDPKIKKELEIVSEFELYLSQGTLLKEVESSDFAKEIIKEMNLLTTKPTIYIANVSEDKGDDEIQIENLTKYAQEHGEPLVCISGKVQEEISQLDRESQKEFISEWGLDELSLDKIIRVGYEVLNLITFFTANENEAHAWTIPAGTTVQKAAGKIHTDFEKGFIKAEVIKFDDLIAFGSEAEVKQHGLMGVHGKDYIVEDGDLIFFRFNI